jgi:hypothetical protein
MDGPRIAYDRFVPAAQCNKVFVANLLTGTSQPVSRCFSYISTSRYLALAGRRIAWIDEAGDPSGYDRSLSVASLSGGKPRKLATASCNGDLDTGEPCVGTWISSLVGSGSLLAVNRGATNAQGVDTRSIQRVDPANGAVQVVAQLPAPLSHASAVVLGGRVFVLGGFADNKVTDQVLEFDPRNKTVQALPVHLPAPRSDSAITVLGDTAYLVGGQGSDRAPVTAVVQLKLG